MRTVGAEAEAEAAPPGPVRRRRPAPRGGVRTALPALIAAGALVLVSCGDSDDDADDAPADEESAEDLQVPEHDEPAPEPDEADTEPSAEPESRADPPPEPEVGDASGAEPDEEPEADGQDTGTALPLTGPTWHVRAVTVDGETLRADDTVTAEVSFAESNDQLSVQACNGISGTAAVADGDAEGEGGVLTMGLGASTLMACPGLQGQIEDALRDFLEGEAKYAVNGDALTLSKDNGDSMVLAGVS